MVKAGTGVLESTLFGCCVGVGMMAGVGLDVVAIAVVMVMSAMTIPCTTGNGIFFMEKRGGQFLSVFPSQLGREY